MNGRKISQGELEHLLVEHGRWLRSQGREGSRADLAGALLSNVDLSAAELTEASLSGADLSGAVLKEANLSRANLSNANLCVVNLSGADLSYAKLSDADLAGADLAGANCAHAELSGTVLAEANLSEANLLGAQLIGANLWRADLSKSNLGGAELTGTLFQGTVLNKADLWGAGLFGTVFANVDLSETRLDAVVHTGPSDVTTSTLQRSEGRVSDVFLRGCGLQDWEIENAKIYDPNLSEGQLHDIQQRVFDLRGDKPLQFFSVFISYSHQDAPFARKLYEALQAKGIRCWLDEKQMRPGDDIYEQVDWGIKHWDKLLLCASKHSLNSWWVDQEVNKAFEKERRLFKERGKKVLALIPLNLDGHLFHYTGAKGDEIRSRIAADFTDEASFEAEVERVVAALRSGDTTREAPPHSRL